MMMLPGVLRPDTQPGLAERHRPIGLAEIGPSAMVGSTVKKCAGSSSSAFERNAMLAGPTPTESPSAGRDQQAVDAITDYASLSPGHPARPARRELAIEAWLPMARRLAQRYAGRGEPLDDLRQVATIGLIKAVDRFDPEQGTDFVAYALPMILGEIKRHFRDRAWSVRVPRRLQEMWLAINEARSTCQSRLGRTPTVADIAAHLGVSQDDVIEGLDGARAYRASSLSSPVGGDRSLALGDTISAEDHGFALAEMRLDLGPAMARLADRERRILTLRFYGNQTQAQIAAQIGVSQMQISRLLAASLIKLRRDLGGR
jgi:RNA polymerase sigma-B factor